jgi:hypothetical protein
VRRGSIVEAIARGSAAEPSCRSIVRPAPHAAAVPRRAEALREWRGKASKEVGLGFGVFFPAPSIGSPPRCPLISPPRQVEGVRDWRVGLFGADLLRVLAVA